MLSFIVFLCKISQNPGHDRILSQITGRSPRVAIDETQILKICEFSLDPFIGILFLLKALDSILNQIYFFSPESTEERVQLTLLEKIKEKASMSYMIEEFKSSMAKNVSPGENLALQIRNVHFADLFLLPFIQLFNPVTTVC
jgi:hypothetical protein